MSRLVLVLTLIFSSFSGFATASPEINFDDTQAVSEYRQEYIQYMIDDIIDAGFRFEEDPVKIAEIKTKLEYYLQHYVARYTKESMQYIEKAGERVSYYAIQIREERYPNLFSK